jgi:hypothetical protein
MQIPTPALPYELPANCILTFTDNTVLEVCLHGLKKQTYQTLIQGVQGDRTEVTFRLVTPKILPATVQQNSRAKAELMDLDTGVITIHTLVVIRIIQSQWKEATRAYGAVVDAVIIQAGNPASINSNNPWQVL